MKTRGGPPATAVRSAVDHGVIPQGAPDVSAQEDRQWEATTSASMCTAETACV
jgi:hypothetical protein